MQTVQNLVTQRVKLAPPPFSSKWKLNSRFHKNLTNLSALRSLKKKAKYLLERGANE